MASDNRLERIENKVDTIKGDIAAINITTAKQQISLDEHIRRTELLEEEVRPIKKHVDMVNGGLKLLGLLLVIFEIYKAVR